MIELHAHLHALSCSSRSPHTARRQHPSRKRAGPAAASRQARAATLCRHTCGMLESYAVVSMCRSAEVSGRALALRDAHQTSSQGASWPGDEVRATSHRPHRFAAEICADLLGALDGGTHSRSNALRVLDRTWTGPYRRRATMGPSRRHGRAVPPPAVKGTAAKRGRGHREVL